MASAEYKTKAHELIALRRQYPRAWLVSEKADAKSQPDWWLQVLDGKRFMWEWTFRTPRPYGVVTPTAAARSSLLRRGLNNPACKVAPKYDVEEIRAFGASLATELGKTIWSVGDFKRIIERKYPKVAYSLSEVRAQVGRSSWSPASMLMFCTGMSAEEAHRWCVKLRGLKISEGQLKSDKHKSSASRCAAALSSSWRISNAQHRLFEIVREFDPNVKMEQRVSVGSKSFSYDMWSPLAGVLIEMNGDFWHRPNNDPKVPDWLRAKIANNLKNDSIKSQVADALGIPLCILWESESEGWRDEIKRIFEEAANRQSRASP